MPASLRVSLARRAPKTHRRNASPKRDFPSWSANMGLTPLGYREPYSSCHRTHHTAFWPLHTAHRTVVPDRTEEISRRSNAGFDEVRHKQPFVGRTYALFPPAAIVTAFGATSPPYHGLDSIESSYGSGYSSLERLVMTANSCCRCQI